MLFKIEGQISSITRAAKDTEQLGSYSQVQWQTDSFHVSEQRLPTTLQGSGKDKHQQIQNMHFILSTMNWWKAVTKIWYLLLKYFLKFTNEIQ